VGRNKEEGKDRFDYLLIICFSFILSYGIFYLMENLSNIYKYLLLNIVKIILEFKFYRGSLFFLMKKGSKTIINKIILFYLTPKEIYE